MSDSKSAANGGARPESYFPGLDGVRAFLLVAVLLRHYNHFWTPTSLAERFYLVIPNLAIPALDVFFAMSGFLITGILLDTKDSPAYFKNFYMRRVLRILPPYYAFLAIWFLILPNISAFADLAAPFEIQRWFWFHAANFLVVLQTPETTFHPQLYHLWSLSFEEQFYLLWPAVVFALTRQSLLRVCGVAFVASLGWRIGVVLLGLDHEYGFVLLPGRLDPLAAGCAMAVLVRQPGRLESMVPIARKVLVATSVGMLLMIGFRHSYLPNDPVILTAGLTLSAVFSTAVVVSVLKLDPERIGGRILLHPVTARVGAFTYAAYIWHWPVEVIAQHLGLDFRAFYQFFGNRIAGQLAYWALLFTTSVLVGGLSWHLLEKHCLKLKRYFSYRAAR